MASHPLQSGSAAEGYGTREGVLTEVLSVIREVGIVEVGLYPNRVYQEVGEFDVEQEER